MSTGDDMRYTTGSRIQTTAYAFLIFVALVALVPFVARAADLHDEITNAIIGLASEDKSIKEASIKFLLAAPPEFRKNIDAQYRAETEALAKSLPQRIDASTTAQSILLTPSELLMKFVIDYSSGELTDQEQQQFKRYLTDQTKKQVCGFGGTALLSLLYGRDFVRLYDYQTGEPFFRVRVTWNDCR